MKVKVESCWNGRHGYFRLTTPNGSRYIVGDRWNGWTRKTASEALDLLETETGIDRKRVRFIHN